MNSRTKNRAFLALIILLLIANATSITMFWLDRKHTNKIQQPRGKPDDFLIRELKLDTMQQAKFALLVTEHRTAVNNFHKEVIEAKEHFFDILKHANATDIEKINAAAAISNVTQQIDLLTLNHFEKVRALCNTAQQKRFDEIIKQVIGMMGEQRRTAGPPDGRQNGRGADGPPPMDDANGERPPPPPDDQPGGSRPQPKD